MIAPRVRPRNNASSANAIAVPDQYCLFWASFEHKNEGQRLLPRRLQEFITMLLFNLRKRFSMAGNFLSPEHSSLPAASLQTLRMCSNSFHLRYFHGRESRLKPWHPYCVTMPYRLDDCRGAGDARILKLFVTTYEVRFDRFMKRLVHESFSLEPHRNRIGNSTRCWLVRP